VNRIKEVLEAKGIKQLTVRKNRTVKNAILWR